MMKSIIVVLLDESGSMFTCKDEVIESFNQFMDAQRKVEEESTKIYLLTFNEDVKVVYRGIIKCKLFIYLFINIYLIRS